MIIKYFCFKFKLGLFYGNVFYLKGVDILKKNIVFLFFLIFLLTGCGERYDSNEDKIIYNLNMGNTFKEKIVFAYSNDIYKTVKSEYKDDSSLEYWLLYKRINPINSLNNVFYEKKILKNKELVNVVLDYEYLEKEFLHSNFIMRCFEKYDLSSYEDYFVVNLSGEYLCWDDKEVEINVTSDYVISSTNGEKVDKEYMWNINKDNYHNVDIQHVISRNYSNQVSSHGSDTNMKVLNYFIVVLIGTIVIYVLLKLYKMKKISSDI